MTLDGKKKKTEQKRGHKTSYGNMRKAKTQFCRILNLKFRSSLIYGFA